MLDKTISSLMYLYYPFHCNNSSLYKVAKKGQELLNLAQAAGTDYFKQDSKDVIQIIKSLGLRRKKKVCNWSPL